MTEAKIVRIREWRHRNTGGLLLIEPVSRNVAADQVPAGAVVIGTYDGDGRYHGRGLC